MRKLLLLISILTPLLFAQEAAPETKLHVVVINDKGKPVAGATVIVRFAGKKIAKIHTPHTQWEIRTTQEGVVDVPEIPQGTILVQVTAKGFQTFGQTFDIAEKERSIEVKLKPPQQQYSAHEN